jgi:hypothetical protein
MAVGETKGWDLAPRIGPVLPEFPVASRVLLGLHSDWMSLFIDTTTTTT